MYYVSYIPSTQRNGCAGVRQSLTFPHSLAELHGPVHSKDMRANRQKSFKCSHRRGSSFVPNACKKNIILFIFLSVNYLPGEPTEKISWAKMSFSGIEKEQLKQWTKGSLHASKWIFSFWSSLLDELEKGLEGQASTSLLGIITVVLESKHYTSGPHSLER